MNCHIIIHQKSPDISIRGSFEGIKQFLPIKSKLKTLPERFTFRDNADRRIEVAVTPDTPLDARIGIDLAKQYLADLSDREPGEIIHIGRRELTKLISKLQSAGKSI
ncbi:MAG: hypothetical protein PHV82_01440 [Victivallaceae bacterium]|nr:hypothetical protein [Victivallaceae bacterium]